MIDPAIHAASVNGIALSLRANDHRRPRLVRRQTRAALQELRRRRRLGELIQHQLVEGPQRRHRLGHRRLTSPQHRRDLFAVDVDIEPATASRTDTDAYRRSRARSRILGIYLSLPSYTGTVRDTTRPRTNEEGFSPSGSRVPQRLSRGVDDRNAASAPPRGRRIFLLVTSIASAAAAQSGPDSPLQTLIESSPAGGVRRDTQFPNVGSLGADALSAFNPDGVVYHAAGLRGSRDRLLRMALDQHRGIRGQSARHQHRWSVVESGAEPRELVADFANGRREAGQKEADLTIPDSAAIHRRRSRW